MSAPEQLPPIPPIIAQLTGPLFLGHLFNWGLFGVLVVQTYIYYLAFPKDRLLPKAIVTTVFILEILQTCLSTRDSFRNFGSGWGNMIDLNIVGWLWFSVPVLGSVICCIGQLFYAWRIFILSRHWWVIIPIILIALVQVSTGIYSGIEAHIIGVFSELQSKTFHTTAVWLGSAALNDIIIATCMIYYLHKARTGIKSTETLITRFIQLTLETGLVCAAFATLDLSFYVAFQNNNYHLAPSIPLSKLYSNSLLVVLNARVRIIGGRNQGTDVNTMSYMDTSGNKTSRGTTVGVTISQEHHTDLAVHIPMDDRHKYNADLTTSYADSDKGGEV